jgi:hypothetical protein
MGMLKKQASRYKTKLHLKLKKGALHNALGIPQGQKIPAGKLAVKSGDSPLMKKRKKFAQTMSHWKH